MKQATAERNLQVRIPGVAPVALPDPATVKANAEANEAAVAADPLEPLDPLTADPTAPAAEQLVTLSKAELDAMLTRGIAQALVTQRAAQIDPATQQELPDQKDIDPFSIKRMVLTKQGYVVPQEHGPDPRDRDALANQRFR